MRVDERVEGIDVSSFREINLLLRLKHENVVTLREVIPLEAFQFTVLLLRSPSVVTRATCFS